MSRSQLKRTNSKDTTASNLDSFFFGFFDFIGSHQTTVGAVFTSVGVSLMALGKFVSLGEGMYWYEWQKELTRHYSGLFMPLNLIGLAVLIPGAILIWISISERIYKHQFLSGTSFIAVGSALIVVLYNNVLATADGYMAQPTFDLQLYINVFFGYLLILSIIAIALGALLLISERSIRHCFIRAND